MPTFEIIIPVAFDGAKNPSTWQTASKIRDAVARYIKGKLGRLVKGGIKMDALEYRETSAEKDLERGRDLIRKDYFREVHGVAEDFKRAAKAGEFTDSDGADEWLHQTIDGSNRVQLNHLAQECILFSDNEDAYTDSFGSDGLVNDNQINWGAIAYSAFRADIIERLDADGVEPSSPETWPIDCDRLSRDACVKLLSNVSIECRDEESAEELREAVAVNVADRTIDRDDVMTELGATAR